MCGSFWPGDWYGTLRQPVQASLAEGRHVILEIDVAGAKAVMAEFPGVLSVFIHPGSTAELERRLRGETPSPTRRLPVAWRWPPRN